MAKKPKTAKLKIRPFSPDALSTKAKEEDKDTVRPKFLARAGRKRYLGLSRKGARR